ncbi:MAG: hypothetical protein HRU75_14200 [Planctomycetia bacterium]|nr:MAG: hypothetical protein HRU75_14200 [Planctomycetia bacterium]
MEPERLGYWLVTIAGTVLCGWWLSIRPGASCRNVATPVAFLLILLSSLLAILTVSR